MRVDADGVTGKRPRGTTGENDTNAVLGPQGFGAEPAALRRLSEVVEGADGEVFHEPLIGEVAADPAIRIRPVRAGPAGEAASGYAELLKR